MTTSAPQRSEIAEVPAGLAEAWQPMAGCAGHTRLTTMVAGHVAAALRAHGLGDRITWDVALQLVPTPAGPRPMAAVYLHTPSAVLGELCGEVVLIEPQHLGAENIERNVRTALERVRQARSASAASGHQRDNGPPASQG